MTTNIQVNKPVLQLGSQGAAVQELQSLICTFFRAPYISVDGIFGLHIEIVVKEMQERFFLPSDGIVGAKTWRALIARKNEYLPVLKLGNQGNLVHKVQTRLAIHDYAVGSIDGVFGAKTEAAVKQFQTDRLFKADGIIGSQTWIQLSYLYPYLSGI